MASIQKKNNKYCVVYYCKDTDGKRKQNIDESTLEKAKNEKVQKQESPSKVSKDVEESVDKMISNRMSKAYSEWKSRYTAI